MSIKQKQAGGFVGSEYARSPSLGKNLPEQKHTNDSSSLSPETAVYNGNFGSLRSSVLKILRKKRNLTLEQLSHLTQTSPSYLSRLENGTRRLNTDLLRKLAHALDCQPSALLEQEGPGAWFSDPKNPLFFNNKKIPALVSPKGSRKNLLAPVASSAIAPPNLLSSPKDLPLYVLEKNLWDPQSAQEVHMTLDFEKPIDWILRPPQLTGNTTGFGVYINDNEYAPKYTSGDIVYAHAVKNLAIGCGVVLLQAQKNTQGRAWIGQFWGWNDNFLMVAPFFSKPPPSKDLLSFKKEQTLSFYKIIGSMHHY